MSFIRDTIPSSVMEVQKSQMLRLWDVFMLGPIMIYVGANRLKGWERNFIVSAGILTMIYNGKNYLENKKL